MEQTLDVDGRIGGYSNFNKRHRGLVGLLCCSLSILLLCPFTVLSAQTDLTPAMQSLLHRPAKAEIGISPASIAAAAATNPHSPESALSIDLCTLPPPGPLRHTGTTATSIFIGAKGYKEGCAATYTRTWTADPYVSQTNAIVGLFDSAASARAFLDSYAKSALFTPVGLGDFGLKYDWLGTYFKIWCYGCYVGVVHTYDGNTDKDLVDQLAPQLDATLKSLPPCPGLSVPRTVRVWQEIPIQASTKKFSPNLKSNFALFGKIPAKVVKAWSDSIIVQVPEQLVGTRKKVKAIPDTADKRIELVAGVEEAPGDSTIVSTEVVIFDYPRFLLFDEVTRPTPPLVIASLSDTGAVGYQSFFFIGDSLDGTASVRVTHISTTLQSLDLILKVISPTGILYDSSPRLTKGNMFNLGVGNAGVHFPIAESGIYEIIVGTEDCHVLPALFQIHLAGNVGLPLDFPRGTRLDTYYNHSAPREETLETIRFDDFEFQETALFKFGNPLSTSRNAIAVLIPPAGSPAGFLPGQAPVRAAPPQQMIDPTVPGALTPGAAVPVPGTVIDLAQVPIPALAGAAGTPPGVAAVLGSNNGSGVVLPYAASGGGSITSLILDMGSGNEIVNGLEKDFRIWCLSGVYNVAVSNTPFADDFKSVGTGSGNTDFDLAAAGLTSARYVRISVGSGVAIIDAVQSLHFFVDEIHQILGPVSKIGQATITMRRLKSPSGSLNPFLELLSVDGSLIGKNDAGFGDDTQPVESDAALINMSLAQTGFYRFLARGYDWQANGSSAGRFFARLETGGNYDPAELNIQQGNEQKIAAQRQGTISQPRQRDSYLFQATPGSTVAIVVNGAGNPPLPDPILELYDSEDFFIAASDNGAGRGRNAALTVALPLAGHGNGPLQSPATYRIVVSGIDMEVGPPIPLPDGVAHQRKQNGGKYELKLFVPSAPEGYTIQPTPTVERLKSMKALSASVAWICGNKGTVLRTISGGTTWIKTTSPDSTYDLTSIEALNENIAWVTGIRTAKSGLWKTSNGGTTWALQRSSANNDTYYDVVRFYDALNGILLGDPEDGYFFICTTSNGGTSWTRVPKTNIPTLLSGEYGLVNNLAIMANSAWFGSGGGAGLTRMYRSTDRGLTWQVSSALNQMGDNLVATAFATDKMGWALGSNGSVAKTTNGGANWSAAVATGLSAGAGIQYLTGTTIAATGGPGGYAVSPDNGSTWNVQSIEGVSKNLFALSILPSLGVGWIAGLDGLVVQWHGTPAVSVPHVLPEALPTTTSLFQNYPNPFNTTTHIRYLVNEFAWVTLKVYDVRGVELATLVNQRQKPGSYQISFDANKLASGVYIYQLKSGTHLETKKFILIR